jgi:peptidoglycan/LPS O-acetylase OafA/YrhL
MAKIKYAGLDHLRAIAIIIVFCFHYRFYAVPTWLETVCGFGWTGVDLFFVLSGYLIGGQLMKAVSQTGSIPYGEFYTKRFFRIIPAYLVVLTIYFTIPYFNERDTLPPLWKFLTFTQNIGLDRRTGAGFSNAWSLCIEEQFYLLLPLLLLLFTKAKAGTKSMFFVLFLFIGGFVLRAAIWNKTIVPVLGQEDMAIYFFKNIYYPTWCRLDGLLTGVSIAALFQFRPNIAARITKHGNLLLLLSLVLIVACFYVTKDALSYNTTVYGYPLVAVTYGVMVLGALSPSSVLYKYPLRLSAFIAATSYSVYLTHKPVVSMMHKYMAAHKIEFSDSATFWLAVATSAIAGCLLYYVVERPFLKLRDRLVKTAA